MNTRARNIYVRQKSKVSGSKGSGKQRVLLQARRNTGIKVKRS